MRPILLVTAILCFASAALADQPSYLVNITHKNGKFTDLGSGSLISPTLVLTCNHNIADRGQTFVTFKNGDQVPAKVVARNRLVDVLVLELAQVRYETPIKVATKRVQPGEQVVIHGFPGLGKVYQTYTGEVSDAILSKGGVYSSAFRVVSPPADQGVSGSPVVKDGKLVGVQFGSFPGLGNFCTHVNLVNQLLETL